MSEPARDRSTLGDPETGIRAVLFDFGGVLTASPFEAFGAYEAEHGLPEGFLRSLNAADHHVNAWARLERGEVTLDDFGELFESEALRAGFEIDAAEVLSLLAGELRPAMVEVVRRCRERYVLGLLTNNFLPSFGGPQASEADGERAGVVALFDEVVESSKVGARKPEPRFFEIALDRVGVAAAEAVFVDDLGVNLKPARELGMRTIKFVSEEQAVSELESVLRTSLL